MMIRVSAVVMAAWLLAAALVGAQAGPPFEFAARLDELIGGARGTLVVGRDDVEFRATESKAARRWDYQAVKQIRVLSRNVIALDTYEDRGRMHLGRDRSYRFEITGTIPERLVAFLLQRVDRPVVTAVMPSLPQTALFEVAVKHQRAGRGSEGSLRLYEDAVAYVTDRDGEARYWRLRDVASVLMLDPYRLELTAYEGGPGDVRPFTFELKTPLPSGMYDALWQKINALKLER